LKIALLLGQYLLQNQTMQLQGLGIFTLESLPGEEKGKNKHKDNDIKFIANKTVTTSPELVEYIAKQTGKIRPLASSDLEDFLNIGKQLLNVSKQFYIEGMGTIILDGKDNLSFSQGAELLPAAIAEEPIAQKHTEIIKDSSINAADTISFENEPVAPRGRTAKNLLFTLAIIAGIGFIGWLAYYFYSEWQEKKTKTTSTQNIQPVIAEPLPDTTAAVAQDSLPVATPPASGFKVLLETAGKNRALKRYQDLQTWGYKVELLTTDSVQFQIISIVDKPLADSTKVLDSITRFFGRKAVLWK